MTNISMTIENTEKQRGPAGSQSEKGSRTQIEQIPAVVCWLPNIPAA